MYTHLQMKQDLPIETPYEKCYRYGVSSLSDVELLAVILRSGTRGRNAIDVAGDVLKQGQHQLLNLVDLELGELKKIPGIGPVKAIELKAVAELSLRISQASRIKRLNLCDASTVAQYYMEQLRHERREQLLISMFDVKCQLLGDETISIGTVDCALLSPREIYLCALQKGASFVIMLHNHPSGIPEPSEADCKATLRIKRSGDILGVPLMDHIIIGDNSYYSFKEKGLIQ